jgi:hypothetical protein
MYYTPRQGGRGMPCPYRAPLFLEGITPTEFAGPPILEGNFYALNSKFLFTLGIPR